MTRTHESGTRRGSPLGAALRAAALARADAFARWAARPPGDLVCAAVLAVVTGWLALTAYGIETAGAVAALATSVAAVLAAFVAVVVWERRREQAERSSRRRRTVRRRRGA